MVSYEHQPPRPGQYGVPPQQLPPTRQFPAPPRLPAPPQAADNYAVQPYAYPTSAPPTPYSPLPYVPVPYAVPQRSAGAAVALELVLGLFGIFGVGNMYAGRAGQGVALMLSFWALFWVNVVLMTFLVGLVTMPLTWIAYMIIGPISAARAVEHHNQRALTGFA
jgi:TM2 domain-containing membrane protein YozV